MTEAGLPSQESGTAPSSLRGLGGGGVFTRVDLRGGGIMQYTDQELKAWWNLLSNVDKNDIFVKMKTHAPSESFAEFADSLHAQWGDNKELSPRQLASIRKWDKR